MVDLYTQLTNVFTWITNGPLRLSLLWTKLLLSPWLNLLLLLFSSSPSVKGHSILQLAKAKNWDSPWILSSLTPDVRTLRKSRCLYLWGTLRIYPLLTTCIFTTPWFRLKSSLLTSPQDYYNILFTSFSVFTIFSIVYSQPCHEFEIPSNQRYSG